MISTTDLYRSIWNDPKHIVQTKVTIAGNDYLDGDNAGLSTSGTMFPGSGPSIGGAVCREIDLELKTDGADIPRSAEIKVFIRLSLLDSTGAVKSASEWIPKGVFYIDTRELDASEEWLSIHGYDAMLKGEQALLDQASGETDEWPKGMNTVAQMCAEKMGVEIDERTVLSAAYQISYPTDYTCRELLQYIAAAHCGNWVITDAGKLRLVPFGSVDAANAIQLGTAMMDFTSSPAFRPFTRVNLLADDENYYTAGNDTGRTLEADCPWATQTICDAVLAKISGYQYVPYSGIDAMLDPAAEIGDSICANGRTSILASIEPTFDAMFTANIEAPADEEIDHEFPYKSSSTRKFNRKIAQTKAAIKVTTDAIESTVEALDGSIGSRIDQKLDSITLSVTSSSSTDGQTTAAITLKVGPNSYTGYIKLDGNVDVSGQLSADALYAALGDIADLTVDRLSTSRRIVKYLAGDQSDDNYIRIHDQYLEFVSGVYANGTEQASNPNGASLYWEADPTGASIGADGYPYVDGSRIFTTTTETNWPVMVYTYTEQVKRSIAFESNGDQYVPVDVFGAGNADGTNQARMLKSTEGLELTYVAPNGLQAGLKAGTSGYLDLYGLRRTVGLNFAGWETGSFKESIEGITEPETYSVEFAVVDGVKVPVKIIYHDGLEMPICWTE